MSLKQQMAERHTRGELIRGTHVTMNDPVVSQLLGHAGFDFLWVDTEHTAIDYRDLLAHISFAHHAGTPALVRLHKNDENHTKRVLDMGPDGVIFPMINTAAEAAAAIESTLYPPHGRRGFGPRGAMRYGLDDAADYINRGSLEMCRFVQLESEEAIANLPEIIRTPHLDGCFFGLLDLANSVGEPLQLRGERITALIRQAVALANKAGILIGVSIGASDSASLAYWRGLGMQMISAGLDTSYLLDGAATLRRVMDEV